MDMCGNSKPVFDDNDDSDDDGPLTFKRTSSAPKQSHSSSTSKKLSLSQKHDDIQGKPLPNQNTHNGDNSSSQKNKVTVNSKPSIEKSTINSSSRVPVPSQSNHLLKNGLSVSSTRSPHTDISDYEVKDNKPMSSAGKPNTNITPKVETNVSLNKLYVQNEEDSDDGTPLSAKFSSLSTTKPKESLVKSEPSQKMRTETKESYDDDSDDEKPLLSRLQSNSVTPIKKSDSEKKPSHSKQTMNVSSKRNPENVNNLEESSTKKAKLSSASATGKVPKESLVKSEPSQKMKTETRESYDDDSDDEKPLLSRLQSNSVTPIKKSDSEKKPSHSKQTMNVSSKRTLENVNNLAESSTKKEKLSSASATGKVRNDSAVRREEKTNDDGDHIPIAQRLKNPVSSSRQSSAKNIIKNPMSKFKKDSNTTKQNLKSSKYLKSSSVPPGSGVGKKWTTLVHNGVIFPPPYKPHGIKMLYDGKPVDLTPEQEEVATMFAVMKETDYASKPKFIENFMNDWRKILGKNHIIKKFELCDFTPIYEWHLTEKEKKKQTSLEERKAIKEEKMAQEEKYMWAIVDGVKEKVGNFRVEPPGLFRGRGEHPKMGMLKRRICPKDITINIGKDAPVPECPIPGERWGEVKHDNSVTWLAFWNDPINPREFKYVFLAASSSLKGQSDKEKYEKARRLKDYIEDIRVTYTKNFTSKDPAKRQIAVATYLIDKLALRAGNEKDDDEAETVGCCTLKVENVTCIPPNKLQFDFLGKDSIRYYNTVEVELPVYKAIGDFQTAKNSDGKKKVEGDDLFDMLDTSKLNAHLKELMPGLTAKVFRTYNASITLDSMLNEQTKGGTLLVKITVYQRANKEVAIICNHQRSVSKSHEIQMSRLNEKIDELKAQRNELKEDLERARKGKPPLSSKRNLSSEMLEKKINQIDEKTLKMETDKNNKEELKTVALGTSKINYLDPRISVAWCKRNEVPIEKIFNKSLLAKFAWAMDVEPEYRF